jgi:hypothetical protein
MFYLKRGTCRQSSSLGRCIGCFGHFAFMCCSLTFLYHSNNTSFFILVFFSGFRQKKYASMWGHYESKVMGIYLGPLNEALGLTTNFFQWYRFFIYGRLCPICFSKELGFGGSISMLQVSYFQYICFGRICFSS